jgi:hypothetical protein
MSRKQLDNFVRLLKASPSRAVFNPWWEFDEENDIGPHSPAIRRKHLAVYFANGSARHGWRSSAKRSVIEVVISAESR